MEQMEEFKTQLNEISSKVSMMFYALMGNDLTKDGGLIKRIDEIEVNMNKMDKRFSESILEMNKRQVKLEIYQKLLWAGAGCIFLLVIQQIFKIL